MKTTMYNPWQRFEKFLVLNNNYSFKKGTKQLGYMKFYYLFLLTSNNLRLANVGEDDSYSFFFFRNPTITLDKNAHFSLHSG